MFTNVICSLLSRLVPDGAEATAPVPPRLRVWDQDARRLLDLLADGCLDAAILMFPDPWPKSRHARRRFVQPVNVERLARVLRPGGEWRIASDDPTYQAWVGQVMAAQTAFAPVGRWERRPDGWPPTRYEAKAVRAGRTPVWWLFERR